MYFEEIHTIEEAKSKKLVPVTVWLGAREMDWLIKERLRIGLNENRRVAIIKEGRLYALFANDMTGNMPEYNKSFDADLMTTRR